MTDHPMIFSGLSIRAIREGRKTQTRRILPPLKGVTVADYIPTGRKSASGFEYLQLPREKIAEPKWRVGDRIWVREQLTRFQSYGHEKPTCHYPSDHAGVWAPPGVDREADGRAIWPWARASLSPIHMPRWASRITLTVVEVRVQQVQEISEEDARAEGVLYVIGHGEITLEELNGDPGYSNFLDCRLGFEALWNSLHGPEGWDENLVVAALTFTVALRNIDDASLRSAAECRSGAVSGQLFA